MIRQEDLIDGDEYVVTFNDGKDCVSAMWIAEYGLFSFLMGSLHYDEVTKIEQ